MDIEVLIKTSHGFIKEGIFKAGHFINSKPISNIDWSKIPINKTVALLSDKVTIYGVYNSARDAAKKLGITNNHSIINLYTNIEKLVNSSHGEFYFVRHPNSIIAQGGLTKCSIIIYDKIEDIFIIQESIKYAIQFLNCSTTTFYNYLDKNLLFKDQYVIMSQEKYNLKTFNISNFISSSKPLLKTGESIEVVIIDTLNNSISRFKSKKVANLALGLSKSNTHSLGIHMNKGTLYKKRYLIYEGPFYDLNHKNSHL